jgi:hypothetical protein
MQTTPQDLRAGWRRYQSWKRRFGVSTRTGRETAPKGPNDLIYLADYHQIRSIELDQETTLSGNLEDARSQKIAFMEAYLSVAAIESHNFESETKQLLSWQMRSHAPYLLGFWFWQSDIAKFGAGASRLFQGESVSIFCERPNQIDFSDVSTILPFDGITVRHPVESWNSATVKRLIDYVKADLAFDGHLTEIEHSLENSLLHLHIVSPERGL